jgi:methyl-accepting chemotaxis protein
MFMKKYTSLKVLFILSFTFFIVVLCAVNSILGVQEMEEVAIDIFAAQGSYVAEKAASMVDGNEFEALSKSLDGEDPFYINTQRELLNIKRLSNCLYLYTMAPKDEKSLYFIIDGSTTPDDVENFSPLGEEQELAASDAAMIKAWETGTIKISKMEYYDEYGWLISVFAPIKTSSGRAVGILGCDFSADHLYQAVKKVVIRQILLSAAAIILGLGLLLFFLRRIFTRLKNINGILQEISIGEGDLTKRISVNRNDEIDELAANFNLSLDKIKNLIVIIKNEASGLLKIGNELSAKMGETAGTISGITGNIRGIHEKVTNQSASVTQTNATMEQVTANIGKLSENVEVQTESVSQSSSAVEEMLANIQSVTQTLIRNAENVEQLISVADLGRNGLQGVSEEIKEIARESEGLLEINAVMENIASQTNLLSMNAAIEAAHAGEAGRGFAVVADEIRKLAESSGAQSKTISQVLKKIKTAIDSITGSTNTVLEHFQAIDERVRTVSQQEANIRSAMEEQGQGSQQILEAIGRLNDITLMVKQGSSEMLQGSRDVIKESRNLERASGEIASGVNEMYNGADQINAAVNRVSEISNENREHINTLFSEVSKFKVE